MFATAVMPWPDRGCPPTPDAVESRLGARVIAVCLQELDPPPCATPATAFTPGTPPYCGESPMVTVRVVGFIASLVPPSFGLGWHAGEIPIDVRATAHVLRFAT
jgi:hypothetical protein